jgi:hypothetical protein
LNRHLSWSGEVSQLAANPPVSAPALFTDMSVSEISSRVKTKPAFDGSRLEISQGATTDRVRSASWAQATLPPKAIAPATARRR